MIKTFQLKVIGKVQGVGFRYYTNKRAQEFGIKGYVKNMTDGSVFIEAEVEESDLKTFVAWCEKGPAWSRVREVKKSEIPIVEFTKFEVR